MPILSQALSLNLQFDLQGLKLDWQELALNKTFGRRFTPSTLSDGTPQPLVEVNQAILAWSF